MSSPWTEEEIKTLVELWPTKSASEISKITGRNRNSIIGRVHRMGLTPKKPDEVRKLYERAAEKRYGHPRAPPKSPSRPGKPFVFRTQETERKPPQPVAEPQKGSWDGVPFLETTYNQCRAVIGSSDDTGGLAICCGKPIKWGSAYSFCEEHHQQYTQKSWGRS